MHDTSFENLELFIDTYFHNASGLKVVDVGSRLRTPEKKIKWKEILENLDYIGVDLVKGDNVDVVLENPYEYPFEDESIDVIIANSIFEHSEFFWELFLELIRILKPTGILYINAPSNGDFHRGDFNQDILVDVYRFYPDSGKALQKWGAKKGFKDLILLESYTFKKRTKNWNDFVAVFLKDKNYLNMYKNRIIENTNHFYNGYSYGNKGIVNFQVLTEDHIFLVKKQYFKRIKNFLNVAYNNIRIFLGRIKRIIKK